MSKPRFNLYAEIDTLAHAGTIRNAIQSELVGKDLFELHNLSASSGNALNPNKIVVSADFRFNTQVDRDSVIDWIKDQIQNHPQIKTWISAAKLTSHICSHDDEEVKDCKTTNYAEWNR